MLAERIAASPLAEMSAQGACIADALSPGDLPRLSRLVAADGAGALEARIGFRVGVESLPLVHLEVRGNLLLTCQRCLAPMQFPVDIDVTLTAVASDAATADLASPFDSVVLDEEGGLALRAMVEDEILSVLPLAPLHAAPAGCAGGAAQGDAARPGVNRPFAALAGLMGKGGDRSRNE